MKDVLLLHVSDVESRIWLIYSVVALRVSRPVPALHVFV